MRDRSGPNPVQSVTIWDRSDPSPKIPSTGAGLDWTVLVWTVPLLDWLNYCLQCKAEGNQTCTLGVSTVKGQTVNTMSDECYQLWDVIVYSPTCILCAR